MKKLTALLLLMCVVCGLAFATAEDENLRIYKSPGCNMGVPASWRLVSDSGSNDERVFLVDNKAVVFVKSWVDGPILREEEDSYGENPFGNNPFYMSTRTWRKSESNGKAIAPAE